MKAKFVHRCTHVLDKEASIKFYEEALGFKVVREMGPEDGSWTNTFMANDEAPFEIELCFDFRTTSLCLEKCQAKRTEYGSEDDHAESHAHCQARTPKDAIDWYELNFGDKTHGGDGKCACDAGDTRDKQEVAHGNVLGLPKAIGIDIAFTRLQHSADDHHDEKPCVHDGVNGICEEAKRFIDAIVHPRNLLRHDLIHKQHKHAER